MQYLVKSVCDNLEGSLAANVQVDWRTGLDDGRNSNSEDVEDGWVHEEVEDHVALTRAFRLQSQSRVEPVQLC